jgi:hypothetical protein
MPPEGSLLVWRLNDWPQSPARQVGPRYGPQRPREGLALYALDVGLDDADAAFRADQVVYADDVDVPGTRLAGVVILDNMAAAAE